MILDFPKVRNQILEDLSPCLGLVSYSFLESREPGDGFAYFEIGWSKPR